MDGQRRPPLPNLPMADSEKHLRQFHHHLLREQDKKPHFFKVLLDGFQEQLRIPPNFVKHIADRLGENAILSDADGRTWTVYIFSKDEGTYFTFGWSKFVQDCELKESDFLVFRYDGVMRFTVFIFDSSACEKRINEVSRDSSHHSSFHSSNSNGKLATEDETKESVKRITGDNLCDNNKTPDSKNSVKRPKSDAVAFTSNYPYFVTEIGIRHVTKGTMQVPARFVRANLQNKRMHLVLRDPHSRAWVLGFTGTMLSAGWPAFIRGNELKVGDFCAFELVGRTEFRVSIFKRSE